MKSVLLGYVPISKETPIPQKLEDVRLKTHIGGPINMKLTQPFRIKVSPIETLTDDEPAAVLTAYQKLLAEAIQVVAGAKKSRFVLYVGHISFKVDHQFVGMIFKL